MHCFVYTVREDIGSAGRSRTYVIEPKSHGYMNTTYGKRKEAVQRAQLTFTVRENEQSIIRAVSLGIPGCLPSLILVLVAFEGGCGLPSAQHLFVLAF